MACRGSPTELKATVGSMCCSFGTQVNFILTELDRTTEHMDRILYPC